MIIITFEIVNNHIGLYYDQYKLFINYYDNDSIVMIYYLTFYLLMVIIIRLL